MHNESYNKIIKMLFYIRHINCNKRNLKGNLMTKYIIYEKSQPTSDVQMGIKKLFGKELKLITKTTSGLISCSDNPSLIV